MFSLKLFGAVVLEDEGRPLGGPAVQRHRLAVLATLAASPQRVLGRDKLMAWLWPERDAESSRRLLNQAIHVLRRELTAEAILSMGEELQLNHAVVSCDVIEFQAALAAGDLDQAARLYAGPFLDGFFLHDAPEFERWVEREREKLAGAYLGVLEGRAEKAEADGDWRTAVERWKEVVAQDPYDSRTVFRLMQASEASGNRAGALTFAKAHEELLRHELDIEPALDVRSYAEQLRATPPAPPAVPRSRQPPGAPPEDLAQRPAVVPGPTRQPSAPGWAVAGIASIVLVAAGAWLIGSEGATRQAAGGNLDEIAQAVARELALRARGDTNVRLPEHRTNSIPAYELYLRGSDPVVLRSDSAARAALGYFQRAVELDSNYAAAWAGLARLALRAGPDGSGEAAMQAYLARAEAAALTAISLDGSLAEAHGSLGLVRSMQGDPLEAETHIRLAVSLEPETAPYREWLVKLYLWSGKRAEALVEAQRAADLAPLSPTATAELARALVANGRCQESLALLEGLTDVDPPLLRVPGIAVQCYIRERRWDEAISLLRPQAEQGFTSTLGVLGFLYGRAGERENADRILTTLIGRSKSEGAVNWPITLVYLGLGDLEQAMPWLERAIDEGSLGALTEPSPFPATVLASLPVNPQVQRLRKRLGLQNE